MNKHDDKIARSTTDVTGNKTSGKSSQALLDNRPQTAIQKKQAEGMAAAASTVLQRKANNTGLPDQLKSGVENLSGHSMDDVKVHYNSDKPAQLNAHAYAQGTDIHLASGQEKHLAHEAWHVVQQKEGRVNPTAQLRSKVSINDDAALEKEADVMGARAMMTHAHPSPVQRRSTSSTAKTVQRVGIDELATRGARIQNMIKYLPTSGINLWQINGPDGKVVYLLGTGHGVLLSQMGKDAMTRQYLIAFLQKEHFTTVLTEVKSTIGSMHYKPDLAQMLEEKIEAQRVSDEAEKSATASRRDRIVAKGKLANADSRMGGYDMSLDDAYLAIASTRERREDQAKVGWLETEDTRAEARAQNVKDMHLEGGDPDYRLSSPPGAPDTSYDEVIKGDQQKLARDVSDEMLAGRDRANPEERNRQWVENLSNPHFIKSGDRQLWIVGAAHLAGLLLRFMDLGWKAKHLAPPSISASSSSVKMIDHPKILANGLTYKGSKADLLSAVEEIAEDRGAEESTEELVELVRNGMPFKSPADFTKSLKTALPEKHKHVADAIVEYILENTN